MEIEVEDEDLKNLILYCKAEGKKYKKFKGNKKFLVDLNKVISIMRMVKECAMLHQYKSLNYEPLKYDLSGLSSVRIGYATKYRLLFEEYDMGVRIKIIEVSEHYGDK